MSDSTAAPSRVASPAGRWAGLERRGDVWLDLLTYLSSVGATGVLLKNAQSAIKGTGDLDVLISPQDASEVVLNVIEWARRRKGQVVVCTHVPDGPHVIVALDGYSHAFVLDLKRRRSLFGAELIDYRACANLVQPGESVLPIRVLRPGAEAVVKAYLYGIGRGPGLATGKLRKEMVAQQLAADPEGVAGALRVVAPTKWIAQRVLRRVEHGDRAYVTVTLAKADLVVRALRTPAAGPRRAVYKVFTRDRCPAMRMIKYAERRLPDDRQAWMQACRVTHAQVVG